MTIGIPDRTPFDLIIVVLPIQAVDGTKIKDSLVCELCQSQAGIASTVHDTVFWRFISPSHDQRRIEPPLPTVESVLNRLTLATLKDLVPMGITTIRVNTLPWDFHLLNPSGTNGSDYHIGEIREATNNVRNNEVLMRSMPVWFDTNAFDRLTNELLSNEGYGLARTEFYAHKARWFADACEDRRQQLLLIANDVNEPLAQAMLSLGKDQPAPTSFDLFPMLMAKLVKQIEQVDIVLHSCETNKNNVVLNIQRIGIPEQVYAPTFRAIDAALRQTRSDTVYARTRIDAGERVLSLARDRVAHYFSQHSLQFTAAAFWLGGVNILSLGLGIWVQSVQESAYRLPPPSYRLLFTAAFSACITIGAHQLLLGGPKKKGLAVALLLLGLCLAVGIVVGTQFWLHK